MPGAAFVSDVHVSAIVDAVKKLCIDATRARADMLRAFGPGAGRRALAAGQQCCRS